jgi:glycosyltransferase involved in cell wall biosynthesis
MKILLTVKSLLPSYGGPAFSVSRLALALAEAGADIGLWACDRSAAMTPLLPAHSRIRPLGGSTTAAMHDFGRPDIVHDNGIWLPHNHRIAALAVAADCLRVVSTRGMLEPWALNHRRFKKRLAWWAYQRRDLCRAAYHHATAEREAKTLRELQLGVPIGVIPNGVDLAAPAADRPVHEKTRTALFLGRIHPIKGLPHLIQAWAHLRPSGWRLHIAGPDEAGYRAALEQQVAAASLAEIVRFLGPLDGEAKERAFAEADLFVLPSFSESFGMAVGEALAHGLPVLTTTGVPWPTIAARGCGWSVPATIEGIAEGLRLATSLDSSTLAAMGRKGREFVQREFSWPNIAKQFIIAYEALLAGGRDVVA